MIDIDNYRERLMAGSEASQSPEAETMRTQIAKLLERAIVESTGGVSTSLCAARDRRPERRGDSGCIANPDRHRENSAAALTPYTAARTRSGNPRRTARHIPLRWTRLRCVNRARTREISVRPGPRNCERRVMSRQAVSAVSIVLLLVVVGALIAREKCRLGTVHWNICTELGFSTVGGPFPEPPSP